FFTFGSFRLFLRGFLCRLLCRAFSGFYGLFRTGLFSGLLLAFFDERYVGAAALVVLAHLSIAFGRQGAGISSRSVAGGGCRCLCQRGICGGEVEEVGALEDLEPLQHLLHIA